MARAHLGNALRQINLLFGTGTLAGLSDAQLLDRHVSHGDELAFEALVQRHGPMVLAVCRGVLNDSNDADDAFQAVFLLLARKARSLWIHDSLGGWLHRVACRIAVQAKADTACRRRQERRAAELAAASGTSDAPWNDTHVVLHEEIDRLPERYREPIVLCYLEHMTYEQAARHLRWSEATTQGRLARARALLRRRLTRRGVTVAGAALAGMAWPNGASAVSLVLFQSALRSARQFHLGKAAETAVVSTAANALVTQAMRSMMITKLTKIAAAVFFLGTITAVTSALPAAGRSVPEQSTSGSSLASEPPQAAASDLPARGGRQSGRNRRRRSDAPSLTMAEKKEGQAHNLTKDLKPGGRLGRGDSLFSALGGFRLFMQADGDLVLYCIDEDKLPDDVRDVLAHTPDVVKLYTSRIWSLHTNVASERAGRGSFCIMHEDGNFVVYDADGRIGFESGTHGHPGSYLRCQDDGNLVIYTPDSKAIWSSGTYSRPPESLDHAAPLPPVPLHSSVPRY